MKQKSEKKRLRLVRQFVVGILYLAFVSWILAGLSGGGLSRFLFVFSAVVTGAVFTGAMVLAWATSWALRTDTRKNQFSIATMLFVTLLAAAYLGAIRGFADLAKDQLGLGDATFLGAAVICLLLTGLSMPFLLLLMESLVWYAAWLVRRPSIQRWLRR